ncbi:MAG: helix-turn-helix domain-containing protein [Clostridia bacterium]|nr:helix-turn-helix domain-containing protein [Clostridia bacterium]
MISNKMRELRAAKGLSLEDLARELGTSRQTIHRYERGTISNIPPEKVEKLAKVLDTTPASLMGWHADFDNVMPISAKRLPVLGEIACGEPIYATEEHESFCIADGEIDADFCLRAHGDSMIGARIQDGDIVFIRSQDFVENGEIAAVIIGEEATLKRLYYYKDEEKLILSPENPRYAPLVYVGNELNQIKIIGRAVAFQSKII